MDRRGDADMKWALKSCAKRLIARLPVPYGLWKSLGVFRHGHMDSADYSCETGFRIERKEFGKWPQLPDATQCPAYSDFQAYRDDELMNRTSQVLLRP